MSDLDDALDSSAPLFDQVSVTANWAELAPGYTAAVNIVDSLEDLGSQVGPNGYTVKQSFDDGLPDPVTMTTGNDASGSMGMDLVGRLPNIADVMDVRAFGSGSGGASTTATIANPTGVLFGDYVLVAIALNSLNDVTDAAADPFAEHGWELLASQADVSVKLWVFGRRFYTGAPALTVNFASASYSWVSTAWYAKTYLNSLVEISPGSPVSFAEGVSGTTHTLPAQDLPSRGWTVGIFAAPSAGGVWTAGAGNTEIVEIDATTNLMIERSALLPSGDEQRVMTATSASATSVVAGVGIPMVLRDRQFMDATAYFSPFNPDSPIAGFERDTAPMVASVEVVTAVGVLGTDIFTGQMADIQLGGRTANLSAVSSTRLKLDKALTLPTVFGRRESCTVDWLVSWLAAQGGQYPGVAPSAKTRYWSPMHGSLHPHLDNPLGYYAGFKYSVATGPGSPFGLTPPLEIDGPFQSAMFAQQTDAETHHISLQPDKFLPNFVPGIDDPEVNDVLSQQNSEGRWTWWIRGDPADDAPDSLVGADPALNVLINWTIFNSPGGAVLHFRFPADTRQPVVRIGNSELVLTGAPLPTDGEWHFCGMVWQYANGLARFRLDNTFWDLSGYVALPALPPTDAGNLDAGGVPLMAHAYVVHLPIAELQLETGPGLFAEQFARFWPIPTAPSLNMLTQPNHKWIDGIAEPAPLQGWTVLQELAQSTASWIRINEDDNLEFLPLEYFGEDPQMTPEDVTLDTEVNAADLDVSNDPSLTRNVVTVQFEDTKIDSNRSPVMDLTAALPIPRGITFITFALDLQIAEVHGAINPYGGTTWDITKLTALQVAGTNPLPNEHFMSLNSQMDGGGVVNTSSAVTGRIVGWDSATVTIRFTNFAPGTLFLSNNGQEIPFLRVLGYAIRTATGYSTVSDPGSVGKRRERALTTISTWSTRRKEAEELANRLVGVLSQPRVQVTVKVMGDPRRRPGTLITLLDAEGTRADGTWRILAITHNGNGPQYTQDLQLLRVPDVLIWDEGTWDDYVWGP
jgi:hypothetical protein